VVADRLAPRYSRLHANFMHKPATVADYVGLLTGLTWTCSAHAKDIWTEPEWNVREKLGRLEWAVTCTRHGFDRLRRLPPIRPAFISAITVSISRGLRRSPDPARREPVPRLRTA
jgi:hypothetical protein